jgi:hypothetical protein
MIGVFGQHHNVQKIRHQHTGIGKRKETTLPENSGDRRRDGSAVSEISRLFPGLQVPGARHHQERPANSTTTNRKLYISRRALEREGKQHYLKILLIGEEMEAL